MLQLLLSTAALAGALTAAPVAADTATFNIDKGHSELTFRIRHIMSRVSGTFTDWKGTITGDPARGPAAPPRSSSRPRASIPATGEA